MPRDATPVFKKSDFLSATKLAKKFNIGKDVIEAEMQRQFKLKTEITIPGAGPRPMIYHEKWARSNRAGVPRTLRIHPLAIDKLYEIITKGK